jgi:polygalacturonase
MKSCTLETYGGKADGLFDNTAAFKAAFADLAQAGGGKLTLSAGKWCSGPVQLLSNTTLELAEGSVLSFIPEPERYTPVFTRWEGVECYAMHACLLALKQKNVTVTGKGVIEGNGRTWWELKNAKKAARQTGPQESYEKKLAALNPGYENQPGGGGGREIQFLRPCLAEFNCCENVVLEGVTLVESPFWTVHPLYTHDLVIRNVTIENPKDAPNTDGIDVDSCVGVEITGCSVSVGDDGICLKSGSGPDGIRVNKPTENVTIKDCTVRWSHGGIVIGSETAAGIRHVLAENCHLDGTDRGIRIKSRRGRGGDIFDITLKNLKMENNLCPIAINMYYKCGITDQSSPLFSLDKQPVTAETPHIHAVSISGITATGCKASAGFIVGLPEAPIENLTIRDCVFSTDETSPASPMDSDMFYGLPDVSVKSFRILNAPGAEFSNVKIDGPKDVFIYK